MIVYKLNYTLEVWRITELSPISGVLKCIYVATRRFSCIIGKYPNSKWRPACWRRREAVLSRNAPDVSTLHRCSRCFDQNGVNLWRIGRCGPQGKVPIECESSTENAAKWSRLPMRNSSSSVGQEERTSEHDGIRIAVSKWNTRGMPACWHQSSPLKGSRLSGKKCRFIKSYTTTSWTASSIQSYSS